MSALCNGGSVLPVIIWFWMHTWMTGHMVPQLWRYMNLHWTNRPTSGGRIGRQMHSSFNYLRIAAWQKKKKKKVHISFVSILHFSHSFLSLSGSGFLAGSGRSKKESALMMVLKESGKWQRKKEREKECGRQLLFFLLPDTHRFWAWRKKEKRKKEKQRHCAFSDQSLSVFSSDSSEALIRQVVLRVNSILSLCRCKV